MSGAVSPQQSGPMQLALGTVQFGLAYGIAGRNSPVAEHEVRQILELAWTRGIRTLDTAAAYGDIEARLTGLCGELPFSVVSKVPAIPEDLEVEAAARWALRSARCSLERLGPRLRVLMLHRAEDLLGPRGPAIWAALRSWSDRERVSLGVSCYEPATCERLLKQYPIEIAQLPGSAFDQRVRRAFGGSARPVIHLRSIFLQGLLLMPTELAVRRVPAARDALFRWREWLRIHSLDALSASMAIAKGFEHVNTCVIGVDSLQQLEELTDLWTDAQALCAAELACEDLNVIDPRLWGR